MATSKKIQLRHCTSEYGRENPVDWISCLPDHLLSDILSLLPTKQAVSTSILSKRWKFLWISITNIDFDVASYYNPRNRICCCTHNTKFTDFVNRVLVLLNQPSICKFRLRCNQSCHLLDVDLWISSAVSRGTQELDLYVFHGSPHKLPCEIFTNTILVVLKLGGDFLFDFSATSVSYPSLKILHLLEVCFEDDDSFGKLFASSPVLEDVVLERISWNFRSISHSIICAPLLKKLDINLGDEDADEIEIKAPALEYLCLKAHKSSRFLFKKFSSLVEATIDIDVCYLLNYFDEADDYYFAVYNFLEGLSHVQFLSLSKCTMESLAGASHFSAPKFLHLKRLKVEFCDKNDEWRLIPKLIEYSKNLETLNCN